jgi:hypothetical protein
VKYYLLDPNEISKLNLASPDPSVVASFSRFLDKNLGSCEILILSHEYLFSCPLAIKNICAEAQRKTLEVLIVGYSRRQCDHVVSAYSQWLFRSPERVEEAKSELIKLGLDPMLFTGVERHLIASIANDFHSSRSLNNSKVIEWNRSYKILEQLVKPLGAEIKCGVLPDKDSVFSLTDDFCSKAGLTMDNEIENKSTDLRNVSFNNELVEALNNSVMLGFEGSAPNDDNRYLQQISNEMRPIKNVCSKEFISTLKEYVKSYFFESNMEFCREYEIAEKHFYAPKSISKSEILDFVKRENQNRANNASMVIDNYRMLVAIMAETCLKLAKNSSHSDSNSAPRIFSYTGLLINRLKTIFRKHM